MINQGIKPLFDSEAKHYDNIFTKSFLGRFYRTRTHKVLKKYWANNETILEINAGTGEDAVFLANLGNRVIATDISTAMLEQIEIKLVKHKLKNKLSVQHLDISRLAETKIKGITGLLSNFGGLNCINDWEKFASDSHSIVESGGIVVVCIMGPMVPWEWVWFLLRGQFSVAFRRVNGESQWRGQSIYYPSVYKFETIMRESSFKLLYREGLGVLMPPSYANEHVEKWEKIYRFIAKAENKICKSKLACYFSDHYLLVFQKQEPKYAPAVKDSLC